MTAKHFVLFASQPYSFPILRPLQQAIRARGDQVGWVVSGTLQHLLQPDETRLAGYRDVQAFNPQAVFSASNWVPLIFPGLKVQLFHGFNVEKRDASKGHFRIRAMFDLYCTQGPSTSGPFRELAEKYGYFKVAETGWPKMDPLFQSTDRKLRECFADQRRPVLMFASTFTESLSAAPHLLEPIKRLIAEEKYNWLLTLHPKMAPDTVNRYKALADGDSVCYFDASRTIDMLKAADAMIGDTSSIVTEFLLQGKPAVTFRNRKPGAHLLNITTVKDLPGAIETALSRPPGLMNAIDNFNTQNHPYTDGKSSERVLTAVDEFATLQPALRRKKPLNTYRKLQHYLKVRKMSAPPASPAKEPMIDSGSK